MPGVNCRRTFPTPAVYGRGVRRSARARRIIVRIELPPGFELSPRRAERDLQLVVLSGEMTVSRGATAHPAGATNLKSGSLRRVRSR
jgi:hypothetical protein